MNRIGITGASGLLGVHVSAFFKANYPQLQIVPSTRDIFQNRNALDDYLNSIDVLVHLAAVNRADKDEAYAQNKAMAETLVEGLNQRKIPVYYSSTIQTESDSPYGKAKKSAQDLFLSWGEKTKTPVLASILPHVFGEWGKPFHNSVVSTFSHQLCKREKPQINSDGMVELLHAQDVAKEIADFVTAPRFELRRVSGKKISVQNLYNKMQELIGPYLESAQIPNLTENFSLQLFNTIRSFAMPERYPFYPEKKEDQRGYLFESLRTKQEGQVFSSITHPGVTRGNHFHLEKVERFCVLEGEARIRIRRLFSDSIWEFLVTGEQPAIIDIPTICVHDITNVGKGKLITQFWSNSFFDPKTPETYPERVQL